MKSIEETKRPGGPLGFALWFEGAPEKAKLCLTQFWHPGLQRVVEGDGETVIAYAKKGEIRWGKRDLATKALALFAVRSLQHLVSYGAGRRVAYSGVALGSLFNAFRTGKTRWRTTMSIFHQAHIDALEVPKGAGLEKSFVVVEGSHKNPVVFLNEHFHTKHTPDDNYPIYIFWEQTAPAEPDWTLHRVAKPEELSRLAEVLERDFPQLPTAECEQKSATSSSEHDRNASVRDERLHNLKREFLRLLMHLVMGPQSDHFETVWVCPFLADAVVHNLPNSASVDEVIRLCESHDAIEDSYQQAFEGIDSAWLRLRPTVKEELRNYLAESPLASDLERLPPLSVEDRKTLEVKVPWGQADVEYEREREKAMHKCRELGFDSSSRRIDLAKVGQVIEVFLELLKTKVRIDKLCLATAGGEFSKEHRVELNDRATTEYEYLHHLLRRSLISRYRAHVAYGYSGGTLQNPYVGGREGREIDEQLEPLRLGWEELKEALRVWTWGP